MGIKVNLEVMDEATLGDRELNYEGDTFTPDFDMFLWGWYLDYDPGSMLSYMTKGQIENWNETCWWSAEYDQLYDQQGQELDPAKRKEIIDRMQQILYEESPYIVTDYAPDFEAYNTAKWDGYIQIPSPNGNTLLPPFGNGGYANFISIQPKVAEATADSGSNTGVHRRRHRRRRGAGDRGGRHPDRGAGRRPRRTDRRLRARARGERAPGTRVVPEGAGAWGARPLPVFSRCACRYIFTLSRPAHGGAPEVTPRRC